MTTTEKITWGLRTSCSPNGHDPRAMARREDALRTRERAARIAYHRPLPDHEANGDEERYANRIANFTKGLPHNQLGEVDPAAYDALLKAVRSGRPADFAAVPLGGVRRLVNPQAGLAFDLEGPDAHALTIPPAPALHSAEEAGEMIELYWMALLRDVHFTHFTEHPPVHEAAAELSRLSDFHGPRDLRTGTITPATIFRGTTPGELTGPLLSQFLLKAIPYGSLEISQRQKTVVADKDYMTSYNDWLAVQNGRYVAAEVFDPTYRHIRNMRDLARYVHVDQLYEAYLNAALILVGMGATFDAGNPYITSRNQEGFGTFGAAHILSLVTEVTTRALKAVWYQKWFVHRRLRPEAFGGLLHNHLRGAAEYPLHQSMRDGPVLEHLVEHNKARYGQKTYLLPMAFPEGSPTHPAYGAGHATVAGACVTILKAWFDEAYVLPDPVVPNDDGTGLVPYRGSDAGTLTVGGELNKLAANIAIGRNMAGVHWRSDYTASIRLGEQVALSILEEQSLTYNEAHFFTLTTFDGERVRISDGTTTAL